MAPRVSKVPIRRQYTDIDYWRAYNCYLSLGGNTKGTARECYLSVSTVRSWVKKWDFEPDNPLQARNPPQKPTDDELETIMEDGNVLSEYESLVLMALKRMREVIPKTNSVDQLGRVVKDLSDRIDRAKGISGGEVPSTVNVNLRLAEAKANGAGLLDLIRGTIASAHERSEHIIEADVIEPPQIEDSHSEDGSTDDA